MEVLRTLLVQGVGDAEAWAPLLLRVGLGLALVSHGYPKLFKTFGQFSGYVASLKWPAPKLFALLAALVEFVGGILLVLGLLVKPVALIAAVFYLLVILTAHKGQKFQSGWELAYLYLLGTLTLWALNTTGPWALSSVF